MKSCSNCGNVAEENAAFCSVCGTVFEDLRPEYHISSNTNYGSERDDTEFVVPENIDSEPKSSDTVEIERMRLENEKDKRSNRMVLLAFGFLIILMLLTRFMY